MSNNLTRSIFWNFNEIHERNILSGIPTLKLSSLSNLEITDGRQKGALRIDGTSVNLGTYPSCISQNQDNNNWCPYGVTLNFWVRFEKLPSRPNSLIGNANFESTNEGFAFYLKPNGHLETYVFKSTGSKFYDLGEVTLDYWYHILFIYDPYIVGYIVSKVQF